MALGANEGWLLDEEMPELTPDVIKAFREPTYLGQRPLHAL